MSLELRGTGDRETPTALVAGVKTNHVGSERGGSLESKWCGRLESRSNPPCGVRSEQYSGRSTHAGAGTHEMGSKPSVPGPLAGLGYLRSRRRRRRDGEQEQLNRERGEGRRTRGASFAKTCRQPLPVRVEGDGKAEQRQPFETVGGRLRFLTPENVVARMHYVTEAHPGGWRRFASRYG